MPYERCKIVHCAAFGVCDAGIVDGGFYGLSLNAAIRRFNAAGIPAAAGKAGFNFAIDGGAPFMIK